MKEKQKRSNVQWRWPFIGFLVLVIVISSGWFLWKSQQKTRDAEDFCVTNDLGRTATELAGCVHQILTLEALMDTGLSVEEILETKWAPRATQIPAPRATQISQRRHRLTEVNQ